MTVTFVSSLVQFDVKSSSYWDVTACVVVPVGRFLYVMLRMCMCIIYVLYGTHAQAFSYEK